MVPFKVCPIALRFLVAATMGTDDKITGWYSLPNQRGTFDILKTCIGTIFLLCWSSVCPNVPSQQGGFWARYGPKLSLFLLAVLGPDFAFGLALGQATAAWRAKKLFKEAGYPEWKMRHCFFANMGGVHLQFLDREAAQQHSFPVTCAQLLYLVRHEYLTMPKISEEDINDRNKTDGLARLIAIVQSLWFTIDSLGRVAQGLFLTTLELTTLAFVFLMTACSICWWRKPMDITRPVIIKVDVDISTVLRETDAPERLQGYTPLSYLDRHEWFMTRFWAYYLQILRNLKIIPMKKPEPGEADHFRSIDFPELELKWELFASPFVLFYSCIFMIAWNLDFPTAIESILWRVASVICLWFGLVGGSVEIAYHYSSLFARFSATIKRWIFGERSAQKAVQADSNVVKEGEDTLWLHIPIIRHIYHRFDWVRNASADGDHTMAIPLRWLIPVTFLSAVYSFSRAYILIEDVIGLRSLPASAYQTVDYGMFSPIL